MTLVLLGCVPMPCLAYATQEFALPEAVCMLAYRVKAVAVFAPPSLLCSFVCPDTSVKLTTTGASLPVNIWIILPASRCLVNVQVVTNCDSS